MPDLPHFLKVRLRSQNARLRIDVLILHVAELRRALLPIQFVQQRLRVEGFEVRRAAGHEQKDHGLRFGVLGHLGRFGSERIQAVGGASLLGGHHGGEGERSHSTKAVSQEFAAVPVVSNMFSHVSSRTRMHSG